MKAMSGLLCTVVSYRLLWISTDFFYLFSPDLLYGCVMNLRSNRGRVLSALGTIFITSESGKVRELERTSAMFCLFLVATQ
jgi:hypothetical protein